MGTSSGFRSAAMLFRYFGGTPVFAGPRLGIHHIPDRSGLPSGARGTGADRFVLPSADRGTFVCLTFSHCARAGVADRIPTKSHLVVFIAHLFAKMPYTEGPLFLELYAKSPQLQKEQFVDYLIAFTKEDL